MKYLFTVGILIFTLLACQEKKEHLNLAVYWKLNGNQVDGENKFSATFELINKGEVALTGDNWELYYSQSPRTVIAGSVVGNVTINHVSGDLYVIRPNSDFVLNPGAQCEITYEARDFLLKHADAPLGIHFVLNKDTVYEPNYVYEPFSDPAMITKGASDYYQIPTAQSIYRENEKLLGQIEVASSRLIPTPNVENYDGGVALVNQEWTISASHELAPEADFLSEYMGNIIGSTLKIGGGEDILLKINGALENPESYQLTILKNQILIEGKDRKGVFYGIQSLIGLIPMATIEGHEVEIKIPTGQIKDSPRFAYRGMQLDVARNFQSVKSVIKLIDIMALYKLNKLHLHLTDDEGWRLESKILPELTEVGANRGYTLDEKNKLRPAYGSGANGLLAGNGYYTQKEYIDILQYAQKRHIEVIPELNMPGHARAAIKAMNARYERLMKEGDEKGALEYYLIDDQDNSEYFSAQAYDDNVVCVCNEAVYHFYETIVDEVVQLYAQAGVPLSGIHTGGDEVPRGVWEQSNDCEVFLAMNEEYTDAKSLQTYFMERINKILSARGLITSGWEEIAMDIKNDGSWMPNYSLVGKEVVPYIWNNLVGNEELGYRLANEGFPIVLCNVTNLYFDLAYDKDPREPGLYWGGFVDTRKAWQFIPEDIYKSTKVNSWGKPFDRTSDFKDHLRLTPKGLTNILGIQGQLWGETLWQGPDMMEYYYLPKLMGLAERAWASQPNWAKIENDLQRDLEEDKAWQEFVLRLGSYDLPRLNFINDGYRYRIAPPGAIVEEGKLRVNHLFGMEVRFTTDGSEPDTNATLYTEPITVSGSIKLKAFDKKGNASLSIAL